MPCLHDTDMPNMSRLTLDSTHPGAQYLCQWRHRLLLGYDPHRRLRHSRLNLPGTTTFSSTSAADLAAASAIAPPTASLTASAIALPTAAIAAIAAAALAPALTTLAAAAFALTAAAIALHSAAAIAAPALAPTTAAAIGRTHVIRCIGC